MIRGKYKAASLYRPLIEITHLGSAKAPPVETIYHSNRGRLTIVQPRGFGAAEMGIGGGAGWLTLVAKIGNHIFESFAKGILNKVWKGVILSYRRKLK